jgi:hypothetical protein
VFAEAENFFKHADRDPAATLTFMPEATRFYLLEAADKYLELAGEQPPVLRVYIIYHALTHPEIFTPQFVQQLRQSLPVTAIRRIQKNQFFTYALQSIEKNLLLPNLVS